jgi:hypothetical protein
LLDSKGGICDGDEAVTEVRTVRQWIIFQRHCVISCRGIPEKRLIHLTLSHKANDTFGAWWKLYIQVAES